MDPAATFPKTSDEAFFKNMARLTSRRTRGRLELFPGLVLRHDLGLDPSLPLAF